MFDRVTREELAVMFGETVPIEAVILLTDERDDFLPDQMREKLRLIAVGKRDETDFSKMAPPELIAHFKERLAKACELPWHPSWNTKKTGSGFEWMEASGPQTMALPPGDPRFRELVVDQAFADAELMADAVNALPRFMELLASGTDARQRQDREDGPDPKGDGPVGDSRDAQ